MKAKSSLYPFATLQPKSEGDGPKKSGTAELISFVFCLSAKGGAFLIASNFHVKKRIFYVHERKNNLNYKGDLICQSSETKLKLSKKRTLL